MALGSDISTKYDSCFFAKCEKFITKCVSFIKKRPQHRCFPAKFKNFLRTAILKNIIEPLLLIARKQ